MKEFIFINSLNECVGVILLICDEYFFSLNCMYEDDFDETGIDDYICINDMASAKLGRYSKCKAKC